MYLVTLLSLAEVIARPSTALVYYNTVYPFTQSNINLTREFTLSGVRVTGRWRWSVIIVSFIPLDRSRQI